MNMNRLKKLEVLDYFLVLEIRLQPLTFLMKELKLY